MNLFQPSPVRHPAPRTLDDNYDTIVEAGVSPTAVMEAGETVETPRSLKLHL